jgi:hypothetical protein
MSTATMLYGAALSAIAAVALVVVAGRDRRPAVLATVAVAAFLMPLCWNLILRRTGATAAFSHDLPFRPVPVSWQDTGSGVFTLAGAALALGLGAASAQPGGRVVRLALCAALGAFLIDIYAY